MINEEHKKYYHIILGGILTKKIIYDKLLNLFNKIKNDFKKDGLRYKDISIHLDLIETEETSLIN